MRPRLGRLNQHAPVPVSLSAPYARASEAAELPKISIVTPSYKQADFIERTIKSVVEQSYPNLEYYVQDGASDDGIVKILKSYSDRLAGWDSSPDDGQSQVINRGFAKTTGEIMAWLNSDDILFPGTLGYVADFFNQYPEIDVVYGNRILIGESDHQIGRWILLSHDDEILSWHDFVPLEKLFWRRRVWEESGGCIDESFRFAMDWDLLVRFRDSGARFFRLPREIGSFRIHPPQKHQLRSQKLGFRKWGVFGRCH